MTEKKEVRAQTSCGTLMAENDEKVEKRKRMKMKKEEERKYEQKRAEKSNDKTCRGCRGKDRAGVKRMVRR